MIDAVRPCYHSMNSVNVAPHPHIHICMYLHVHIIYVYVSMYMHLNLLIKSLGVMKVVSIQRTYYERVAMRIMKLK